MITLRISNLVTCSSRNHSKKKRRILFRYNAPALNRFCNRIKKKIKFILLWFQLERIIKKKRYIIQRLFEKIRGKNFEILFMEKNEMKSNGSIRFNCYIFSISDDYFVECLTIIDLFRY